MHGAIGNVWNHDVLRFVVDQQLKISGGCMASRV